jgi:O-antigen biosynthesis protein
MRGPAGRKAIAVRIVDLLYPLEGLSDVSDYRSVWVLVLWNGHPLGSVQVDTGYQPVGAGRLREAIIGRLSSRLLKMMLAQDNHAEKDSHTAHPHTRLPADVPVSIVVATRDRPDNLRQCLRCLTIQATPRSVEAIVVDNNPASRMTPPIVAEFPCVILVQEERRGLSYARNAGILASHGAIIVTTDDDVTMPPVWLENLLTPFVQSEVMAVTGNVLPAELETTAQQLFETYGGLGRGFEMFVVDGRWFRQLKRSVPTWRLGATANAAFRATIFTHPDIGLLDEALGPGTPTGVGEDTYLFYKVLKAGYTMVYEPRAYVWHKHRRSVMDLRRQIFDYSKGHVAYHLTTLVRDHDFRALVRVAFELPVSYFRRIRARLRRTSRYPVSLILTEIAGNLLGPWSLVRAHVRVRRLGPSGGNGTGGAAPPGVARYDARGSSPARPTP